MIRNQAVRISAMGWGMGAVNFHFFLNEPRFLYSFALMAPCPGPSLTTWIWITAPARDTPYPHCLLYFSGNIRHLFTYYLLYCVNSHFPHPCSPPECKPHEGTGVFISFVHCCISTTRNTAWHLVGGSINIWWMNKQMINFSNPVSSSVNYHPLRWLWRFFHINFILFI